MSAWDQTPDVFDFEDDLADEIVARVGNQQYHIREEQVAGLDDWQEQLYEMEEEEELEPSWQEREAATANKA